VFIQGRNAHGFDDVGHVCVVLMGILRQTSNPVSGITSLGLCLRTYRSPDVSYRLAAANGGLR
jgi:hypothetical protein